MWLRYFMLSVLLLNSSCLKYKKTYKPNYGGDDGAYTEDSGDYTDDSGDSTDDSSTSDDSESTELTASHMKLLEEASKSKPFKADVNLQGTHTAAQSVSIDKGTVTVLVSGLKSIQSGQMKIEIADSEKALQMGIRLSNVNVSSDRLLRISLSKCTFKTSAAAKAEKEASCNWSVDQAL